jgi:hypothetical protein
MVTPDVLGRPAATRRVSAERPAGSGGQHLDSLAGVAVGYVCFVAG